MSSCSAAYRSRRRCLWLVLFAACWTTAARAAELGSSGIVLGWQTNIECYGQPKTAAAPPPQQQAVSPSPAPLPPQPRHEYLTSMAGWSLSILMTEAGLVEKWETALRTVPDRMHLAIDRPLYGRDR